MPQVDAHAAREYYRRITEVEIGEVARELLDRRIQRTTDRELVCDCPHHQSQSKRSLTIMLDKQGWYCFGCGVGGDVLQLVEFVQSGEVTVGHAGPMPESHRSARDWLAARIELPPLNGIGLSEDEQAEMEAERTRSLRVHEALTGLADIYYRQLMVSPEALDWVRSQYQISDETIACLKIGYATGESVPADAIAQLTSGDNAFTVRELAATGAFRPTPQDTLAPFFRNRIVFPYWSRGHVVFMIARQTPWTPDEPWEQAKYKKLPVHDDDTHRHIAACVDNSHLYNEDCLLTKPDRVVITEGVTDCIALMDHGFSAVSPVTVRIRSDDWERITPKLVGIRTLYICQDNEVSGAGFNGALQTARTLAARRIDTRVVILPLGEKQIAARETLTEQFGIDAGVGCRELRTRIDGRPDDEIQKVETLLADAKIDVNEYFAAGHTAEEFEVLLTQAQTPLEMAIGQLPTEGADQDRERPLEAVLREVAERDAVERERYAKAVHAQLGKAGPSLQALKSQISELLKGNRARRRRERRREKLQGNAAAGSCLELVEAALVETEETGGSPDYDAVGKAVFDWLAEHDSQFFRTRHDEPFMFFENEILWMDSGDRTRKRRYWSRMYRLTGISPATQNGRVFYEALANLAAVHGAIRDQLSWLHTDIRHRVIYFNLNNEDHEIAKITTTGVEILKNGGNEDGIILASSRKMRPIRYAPNADPEEAERLIRQLIYDHLTCPPSDRMLIILWASCFLLIDFSGTKPMVQFEGPTSSGKTTGAKLVTTLIYGEPQQKKSTDAANYTDGSQNPLISLDNIEVRQMTEELLTFMLTCVTGIAKEKRKGGTDTETVTERPKCLLNTTGVEPLGGELSEILSRSFVIRFDRAHVAGPCFLEAKAVATIAEHRDVILSGLMKRTAEVLAMMEAGAQERVMGLLSASLGDHDKQRCNDFLSLMYLMMLAGEGSAALEEALSELHTRFTRQIASLNETTQVTARESNPIATALATVFRAYENAREMDDSRLTLSSGPSQMDKFRERYQITFTDDHAIEGILARELFVTLKRVAKEFNLSFSMRSTQQFAQRLANDLATIEQAGFTITTHERANRPFTYDIRPV